MFNSRIADTNYETIDFISDEQLIKWANNLVPPEARITKRDLSELKIPFKAFNNVIQ